MRITQVVPHYVWVNKKTGAQASQYSASPSTSSTDAEDWTLEQHGFTWELDDGTSGLGRRPAATRAEAEEVMHKFNNREF